MTVVIDTNVVIRMFGKNSPLQLLVHAISHGSLHVAVSPAIWLEYEEVCLEMRSPAHWQKLHTLFALVSSAHGNIVNTNPDFRFQTIHHDPDDNAFADCAITAHADFILTDDSDYRPLKNAGYKPQPIKPEDFISRYLQPLNQP